MPVSDFIHDRLYNKQNGYFNRPDAQLGYLAQPIDFNQIFGYEDYTRILAERYPKNAWLTPSEIFKPYYGMTIGNYINFRLGEYQEQDPGIKSQRVKIIEVGAGNGSAANSILNYFKLYSPLKYKQIDFKIIEISPVMIERCRKELSLHHSQLIFNGQITFHSKSILDYDAKDTDVVFVVLLEVLDNMPHDRVYFVIYDE